MASDLPLFRSSGSLNYHARSLLELNVLLATGAILNKPRWWVKWRHEGVRTKWLQEVGHEFVARTLPLILLKWPGWDLYEWSIRAAAAIADPTERVQFLTDKRQNLLLRAPFRYQDDRAAEDETNLDKVLARNLELESYGQIGFYFQQKLVWERALALPADCWTRIGLDNLPPTSSTRQQFRSPNVAEAVHLLQDFVEQLPEPQNCANATVFLVNVVLDSNTPSEDQVQQALAGQETRIEAIRCLTGHCRKIRTELSAVHAFIAQSLELIIKRDGLNPKTTSASISPGPAQETWLSDGAVDTTTRDKFISEVKQLEDIPAGQQDWHPNTDRQVLDLVHPSLYCCVFGKTRGLVTRPPESEMSTRKLFMTGTEQVLRRRDGSNFQWIPSEFHIDAASGKTRILSYINNLHPVESASMYESIAGIFDSFVPLFDRVLNGLAGPPPNAQFAVTSLFKRIYQELPKRPIVPTDVKLQELSDAFTIRGRTVQVIVKIAEIVLSPDKPKYRGGSWHVEGTDAEQIRATGLYYFGCENITESRLSFRVPVDAPDYVPSDHMGVCSMYGLQNEERLVQSIGSITARNGRCVVFPNSLEHKVEAFELADAAKPGTRKILAFFLVDPAKTIPSTAVISAQQESWVERHETPVLKKLKLPETVESSVRTLVGSTMTLDQAREYRLALMAERSPVRDDDDSVKNPELYFSLCEH